MDRIMAACPVGQDYPNGDAGTRAPRRTLCRESSPAQLACPMISNKSNDMLKARK